MLHIMFWFFGILNGVCGDAVRCSLFDTFEECNLELDEIIAPLTKHKLGRFCSQVQEFYDCYDKKSRKVKKFPCGDGDSLFMLLISSRHIVQDLCDKTSSTQKDFLNNLPCLSSIGDEFTLCEKKLEIMYKKHTRFLEGVIQKNKPPATLETCLKVLYRITCVIFKIPKICGETSNNIFEKVIEDSGILDMYCTESELEDAMIIMKLDQELQKSEKSVITLSYLFDWLEG